MWSTYLQNKELWKETKVNIKKRRRSNNVWAQSLLCLCPSARVGKRRREENAPDIASVEGVVQLLLLWGCAVIVWLPCRFRGRPFWGRERKGNNWIRNWTHARRKFLFFCMYVLSLLTGGLHTTSMTLDLPKAAAEWPCLYCRFDNVSPWHWTEKQTN